MDFDKESPKNFESYYIIYQQDSLIIKGISESCLWTFGIS